MADKFPLAEMEKAFDLIANPDDWRAPIKVMIPESLIEIGKAAVEFYTGTELKIVSGPFDAAGTSKIDYYSVEAVGYRNGPAGP